MRRCVLDILLGGLFTKLHSAVLIVKGLVFGEDVLLVVSLERLAQLNIGYRIAALLPGQFLEFLVQGLIR